MDRPHSQELPDTIIQGLRNATYRNLNTGYHGCIGENRPSNARHRGLPCPHRSPHRQVLAEVPRQHQPQTDGGISRHRWTLVRGRSVAVAAFLVCVFRGQGGCLYASDQIRSVAQSCPTLCDPMNCSTPGLPVHHQLPEFTQTHVHRVSDAIQPSHPLSSPLTPAPNPSQHQSLFQ